MNVLGAARGQEEDPTSPGVCLGWGEGHKFSARSPKAMFLLCLGSLTELEGRGWLFLVMMD